MSKSLHSRSVSVGKSELVGAYTITEMQCTSDNLRESSSDSPLLLMHPPVYNRSNHICKSERIASYHDIRRTILQLLPFHQGLQESKFAHLWEIDLEKHLQRRAILFYLLPHEPLYSPDRKPSNRFWKSGINAEQERLFHVSEKCGYC